MTYYGAKQLADSLRQVRSNTVKTAEDIPEDKYDFSPAPESRSVRQLLTHIALGHRFQQWLHAKEKRSTLQGIDFPKLVGQLMAEEARPRTKAEILDLLRTEGESWARWIETLPESFLGEQVGMPPGATPAAKSRFEMLLSTKEHEMHHRAQVMLIQRVLGIVPHLTRQMQERMAHAQAGQAAQQAR